MEHTLQTFFVSYIKNQLVERNMSQDNLANQLDTTKQSVSHYLTGKTNFTLNMFEKFADTLEIYVIDIVSDYHQNVVLK